MAIENFTTYTEVDANGHLTVAAAKATALQVGRNEEVYLYKDFGANYFNALNINFEIYVASSSTPGAFSGMGISNGVSTFASFASTDVAVMFYVSGTPTYNIILYRGAQVAQDAYVGSANTIYYCTLGRTAGSNTVTCKIYSDAARTNLLATLSVSGYGTSTKWRYAYGFVNSHDQGSAYPFNGYTQNLDLAPTAAGFYPVIGGGHIIDVVGGDE